MKNVVVRFVHDLITHVLNPLTVKPTASQDVVTSIRDRLTREVALTPNQTSTFLLEVLNRFQTHPQQVLASQFGQSL